MSGEIPEDFAEHTGAISESQYTAALRVLEAQATEFEKSNAERFKFAYIVLTISAAWVLLMGALVTVSGTPALTLDFRVLMVMSASAGGNVVAFVLLVGRYLFSAIPREVSPPDTSA